MPRTPQMLSRVDLFLDFAARKLKRHRIFIFSIGGTFLLGRITDTINIAKTPCDLINYLFSFSFSQLNIFSWIALLLLMTPILEKVMSHYYHEKRYDIYLSRYLTQATDPWLRPFTRGRGVLAIDSNMSLIESPDLDEGWKLDEIIINYDPTIQPIPSNLIEAYKSYYKANDRIEGFSKKDGIRYMLLELPRSLIDEPQLTLTLGSTKYSCARFYNTQVASISSERTRNVQQMINGTINFHHSFACAAVVRTSDKKILAVHRSHIVKFHPHKWALSIDEQLSSEDIKSQHPFMSLANRVLFEELGVLDVEADNSQFRGLSVYLESDLSTTILFELPLLLNSNELEHRLRIRWTKKKDPEIDEYKFMEYSDLVYEIKQHGRDRITTYRYIALLFLARHLGLPKLATLIYG